MFELNVQKRIEESNDNIKEIRHHQPYGLNYYHTNNKNHENYNNNNYGNNINSKNYYSGNSYTPYMYKKYEKKNNLNFKKEQEKYYEQSNR